MTERIENLEPRSLWHYFMALSAIPRGSKNETQVARYVLEEAEKLGLEVHQDAIGNVIARKPATPGLEHLPVTVLQGHLDMVCEKNEDTIHDFLTDPIRLVRDGDFVRAEGTTLGADNGIGVAAALAVMAAADINHGPLEFLFTVDEETGLTGAFKLEPGALLGTRLLNLDSEEENAVYIGCAGGMDSAATLVLPRVAAGGHKRPYRIKIAGLKGGHSGLNISEGRGNALKLLARILRATGKDFGLEISAITGGSKRNAIPREAFAVCFMDSGRVEALRECLRQSECDFRSELGPADPDVTVALEDYPAAERTVYEPGRARQLVDFLYAAPHGVLALSPDIPGLVQTSTNLAIVENLASAVQVHMSHRSSVESAKRDVGNMVAAYCELAGFEIVQGGGYPGWKPDVQSKLLQVARRVHQEIFGHEPEVKAIHAGLECGIIGEKFPGMDMISFGPTIIGAHSPTERVSIPAVENFWRYLLALLQSE